MCCVLPLHSPCRGTVAVTYIRNFTSQMLTLPGRTAKDPGCDLLYPAASSVEMGESDMNESKGCSTGGMFKGSKCSRTYMIFIFPKT